jgi:hypothetical protein
MRLKKKGCKNATCFFRDKSLEGSKEQADMRQILKN